VTGAWVDARPGPVDRSVVWRVDLRLSEDRLRGAASCLSEEERARAARFGRSEDRHRFLASHAALRLILGRALGTDPAALAFVAGPAGKPELGPDWPLAPYFNLSHSGDWALIGLSPTSRIGVDVEAVRPIRDAVRIACTHFHPDEAAAIAARSGEAARAAFFAVWTCKEAFVKGLGLGLSMPLDAFAVSLPPAPAGLVWVGAGVVSPAAWSLHRLAVDEDHFGAVAIEAAAAALRQHTLPRDWIDLLPGPARE
jgi:4'-phosphopantetheinyl transferase